MIKMVKFAKMIFRIMKESDSSLCRRVWLEIYLAHLTSSRHVHLHFCFTVELAPLITELRAAAV